MDEQERVDRLAEAIDTMVLEGREVEADSGLAPLVSLASGLSRAWPPVHASPAFQESLRSRLVTPRVPWWKRLSGGYWRARVLPSRPVPRSVGRAAPAGLRASEHSAKCPPPPPFPTKLRLGRSLALQRYAAVFAVFAIAGAAVFLAQRAQDAAVPVQSLPANVTLPTAAALAAPSLPPQATDVYASSSVPSSAVRVALPPLSESNPSAVPAGLGGGSLGGPEGGFPTREVRFELAASLPEMPSAAVVYRYAAPSPDPDRLRRVASSLGFDPDALRPMSDAPDAYVLVDPARGSLDYPGPGGPISYRVAPTEKKPSVGSPVLPSEEEAVDVAVRWLTGNGLLPEGAGKPIVSRPYPRAPFEEVVFRPSEPANIVGDYPVARVGIDAEGTAISATLFWPEVESTLTVPARTGESAWEALRSGRGRLVFEVEHGRPDFHGGVTVTSVDTGYSMVFGLDGRPYLQPVVVFRGESVMDGDPERHPFLAEVPLAADSALAREEVLYFFDASLPSVPPEAAVLERDSAPPPTKEQVRELGLKLGLAGEPRSFPGPSGQVSGWEMGDPHGMRMLRVSAETAAGSWMETWNYSPISYEPPSPAEWLRPLDAVTAVRIATDFLRGHDLLATDLAPGQAQPVALGASVSTVFFPRLFQGLPVVEPAGLAVVLDPGGEVVGVISNQHPLRVVRTGKLLAPAEALAAVKAGNGAINAPSLPGRTIYSEHATIEKVELVYRLRVPEAGGHPLVSGQPPTMRYEPYYAFSGTIEVGESRKPLPFTTSLPALK